MNYHKELFKQHTSYLQILLAQQEAFRKKYENINTDLKGCITVLPFCSCMDSLENMETVHGEKEEYNDSVYVFVRKNGTLTEYALERIADEFTKNENAILLYADEDYAGTLKELYNLEEKQFLTEILDEYTGLYQEDESLYRGEPWFKPDYSPDTLKAFFYMGSVVAVRSDIFWDNYEEGISLYGLVLKISEKVISSLSVSGQDTNLKIKNVSASYKKEGIIHLSEVIYTNASMEHIDALEGFNKNRNDDKGLRDTPLVSIVIPSKDNSKLLEKCINSIIDNTVYQNYEFVIVDNGSCDREKMQINQLLKKIKQKKQYLDITYIYEKMDFNFSKMCNAGAEVAKGEYLLFLNDDIEVPEDACQESSDWLKEMLVQAQNIYAGAVGAKLCYPKNEEDEAYKIQHTGITNMGIGPAHKLCGIADDKSIYHGRNVANHNVIAVTAACLMLRRSYFGQVHGFDEELAVAYNDVELCFKLHEQGFFNVVLNVVRLIHHESVTRGQDTSPEKQERLISEKEILYKKHPNLYAEDIFYNKKLIQFKKDNMYNPEYRYEYNMSVIPQMLQKNVVKALPKEYHNRLMKKLTGQNNVMVQIDSVEQDYIQKNGIQKKCFVVQGWSVLRNSDNARVERTLLLKKSCPADNIIYQADINFQLREDVSVLFANDNKTKNTSLAGINLVIEAALEGDYQIGVLMRLGNKRYVRWTENILSS